MSVVDRILCLPELQAAPPVLVDVGAAQGVHEKWQPVAKYSTCVAFEADPREFHSVTSASSGFRQLTTYNAIAAERASEAEPFYLTASPFCSSRLRPRADALSRYAFAPLFEVEESVELRAVDLPSVLEELGVSRVDWIKVDSQGTDLRLFRSLADLAHTVLVAELEPGIIDAYEGEDKLGDVLKEMEERGFWVSEMTIRGSTRIASDLAGRAVGPRAQRFLDVCHKTAPGWAEIEYFNELSDETAFGKRELLLGCAFAFMCGQNGFALELAGRGRRRFGAPFEELARTAERRIKAGFARFPGTALTALGRRALRR